MHSDTRREADPSTRVRLQHRPDVHHDLHQLQVQPGTASSQVYNRLCAGSLDTQFLFYCLIFQWQYFD